MMMIRVSLSVPVKVVAVGRPERRRPSRVSASRFTGTPPGRDERTERIWMMMTRSKQNLFANRAGHPDHVFHPARKRRRDVSSFRATTRTMSRPSGMRTMGFAMLARGVRDGRRRVRV